MVPRGQTPKSFPDPLAFSSNTTKMFRFVEFCKKPLVTIGWIAMKSVADIHAPLGMNPTNVGDPFSYSISSR